MQPVVDMRIYAEVPDEWRELIEKAVKMGGWRKKSDYLRELVKKELERV